MPTAVTISGKTKGAFTNDCKADRNLDGRDPAPIAKPAAIKVVSNAQGTAIDKETFADLIRSEFSKIVEYQRVEKPFQVVASSDLLNEKIKTANKGMYRKISEKTLNDLIVGSLEMFHVFVLMTIRRPYAS